MSEQTDHYQAKLRFEIDAWDLHHARATTEAPVIVDARGGSAYAQEHIAGAIHFPHGQMDERTTRDLDRDSHYVVYCDGIGCNAATQGALKLARLGFKVRELMGGLEWWKRSGYPTEGAREEDLRVGVACACAE